MKNIRRKFIVILAFGLVLSVSTPAFATETETQDDTTTQVAPSSETSTEVTPASEVTANDNTEEEQKTTESPLKASANAVVAKTGLSFEIGATPTTNDFVTINDSTNNPTLAFKNGQPATTTAGNYTAVILVTFDDTTSTEITANYIVKAAATPLATLKTKPTFALGSKPTPSQFATPATGVQLSFKSGVPSTKKTGTFKTTIVASKNGVTEELIATFVVADQEAPKVELKIEGVIVINGTVLTPSTFVTATDNSGKVSLSFKPGHEPSTSRLGMHSTTILATDPSGNTTEYQLYYHIYSEKPTFKTPVIDVERSTATTIYGTTTPNVGVIIEDLDGNYIGWGSTDATGHFIAELYKPLEPGDEFIIYAATEVEYSEAAYYIYDIEYLELNEQNQTPTKEKTKFKVASNKTSFLKTAILPKTGDEHSLPLVAFGLILASGAAVVLRKK